MQAESSFQIEASQEFKVSGKSCKSFPTSRICHIFVVVTSQWLYVVLSCSNYSLSDCLPGRIQRNSLVASSVGLTQILKPR